MPERTVLGIDAAWTLTQPSGVALAAESSGRWQIVCAEPSYEHFFALAEGRPMNDKRPEGALPDVPKLLASAARLCGRDVQLAAIDMPLAYTPICGRRTSDNDLSRAYGARKCGTHTPSVARPGTLSTLLREAFDLAGYPLLTTPQPRGLIEVYPHPALVELAQASMRLPYKVSKVRSYWPSATPSERRTHLFAQWTLIEDLLERELSGIAAALPTRQRLANTADQSLRGHTRRHCVYVDWNLHTRRTSETVRR